MQFFLHKYSCTHQVSVSYINNHRIVLEFYSSIIKSAEKRNQEVGYSHNKFIMMTKFIILAVAIIGLATRPSSAIPAKQAIDEAYNATVAGAVSLKFTLWRAANCPMEDMIRTVCVTMGTASCYICVCNGFLPLTTLGSPPTLPANCDAIIAPLPATGPARLSWMNEADRMTQWPGIAAANASQLYAVDDGFCYASEIHAVTGRTMACFSRRILT